MRKLVFFATLACLGMMGAKAEVVEPLNYGNFDRWITRNIKESAIIGGNEKKVYEIGPNQTINGAKAYTNLGGSPWGTSNVYAKVAGVVKTSNTVYPDVHGSGRCAKLTTAYEHVKALGIISMDVLASGTIFLGQMVEPVNSTKNPYSKMNMGVRFNKRPHYLQFEYKLHVPSGQRIYSSGFGKKKNLPGQDYAEVFILLQRRWEDSKGNIHAARVGTGRQRFGRNVPNWTKHRIPIWYGNITNHAGYQSYMGLIPKDKNYYAKNSKGKMVPIIEEKWDDANATPTHMVVMMSSGCGTAYTGTPGMTLWVDNVSLVY